MEGIGQKKETDYILIRQSNVMYVGRNLKQSR